MARQQVNIAVVGTGFIAETRARAYAGVTGYEPRIVAAVSRTRPRLEDYARRHGVPGVSTELAPVLERADIDVVDLCVPNHLHMPMAVQVAQAGKHVIVSKPLTAFDGAELPPDVAAANAIAARTRRTRSAGGIPAEVRSYAWASTPWAPCCT